MWTVIYMMQTKDAVRKIQEILAAAGLPVHVKPVGESSDSNYYEILVPETEVQLAHEILIKNGY